MAAARYRFDRFELQPAERRLLVDGAPAALGARAYDLLMALVERRGRTVAKDELLAAIWPGVVVEEAAATMATKAPTSSARTLKMAAKSSLFSNPTAYPRTKCWRSVAVAVRC